MNSIDNLPLPGSRNLFAGDISSRLPDGRPNPQFYGIDWLIGTPDGTKIVRNPFEPWSAEWLAFAVKDKASYLLLGGAALFVLFALSGRRR